MKLHHWPFAALFACVGAAAWAGPPYDTDDPEPTDTGHWEIYAFGQGDRADGETESAAGVDLNYGALPGVQLTATVPLDFASNTRAAFGDLEFGVKYRFVHDEAAGFQVAAFPRAILPTAPRRFGTGRVQLRLPLWAQQEFGRWSLFGGGGVTLNPGAGNRDYWQFGLALTRDVSPRLSLGGEITHETADAIGAGGTTALGAGAIYRLGGPFSLLASGGPSFGRDDGVHAYLALGVAF